MTPEQIRARIAELRSALASTRESMAATSTAIGDTPMTAEQQSEWDGLTARATEQSEQLAAAERELAVAEATEQRQRDSAASLARFRADQERWRSTTVGVRRHADAWDGLDLSAVGSRHATPDRLVRDRAQAVLDDEFLAGHLEDRQRAAAQKSIRTSDRNVRGDLIARMMLLTSHEAYRSAFVKLITQPAPILSSEEARLVQEVHALRAASLTDASGGYAVPTLVDPTVILTSQGSPNDILSMARVETITADVWYGLSSAGVSWSFRAEGGEATDNAPTIAQPSVTTRRADGTIPFSVEIGQDWPGFVANMTDLLAAGYDELLAYKLTSGTSGSNEPIGLVTRLDATTTSEKELATAATWTAADVYALWDALPSRWKRAPGCAFMSSTDVQNDIRQLGTVDPNFLVNMASEGVPALFGRRWPVNDYMADTPTGTGTELLLAVGDFQQFVVAQRAGMSVELVPHLFGSTNRLPTGQRALYAWARVGSDLIVPGAFRAVVNKSA